MKNKTNTDLLDYFFTKHGFNHINGKKFLRVRMMRRVANVIMSATIVLALLLLIVAVAADSYFAETIEATKNFLREHSALIIALVAAYSLLIELLTQEVPEFWTADDRLKWKRESVLEYFGIDIFRATSSSAQRILDLLVEEYGRTRLVTIGNTEKFRRMRDVADDFIVVPTYEELDAMISKSEPQPS